VYQFAFRDDFINLISGILHYFCFELRELHFIKYVCEIASYC